MCYFLFLVLGQLFALGKNVNFVCFWSLYMFLGKKMWGLFSHLTNIHLQNVCLFVCPPLGRGRKQKIRKIAEFGEEEYENKTKTNFKMGFQSLPRTKTNSNFSGRNWGIQIINSSFSSLSVCINVMFKQTKSFLC